MSVQVTVTGTFSDSSTSDVTAQATFVSDDVTVALVSSPGGLVSYGPGGTIYGGQAGVTASVGSVSSSFIVRIVAADSGSQRMPLSDVQWTDCGLSPWGSYGGCQEATGSLVLSGTVDGTLVASASPVYQFILPGWSRHALHVMSGTAQRFSTTASIPSLLGPVAYMCYAQLHNAGVGHVLMGQTGNATTTSRLLSTFGNSNSRQGIDCGGTLTTGTVNHRDGRVHPFLMVYDPINLRVKQYTDVEALTGTFTALLDAPVSPVRGFSQVSTTKAAPSASFVYVAIATGSIVGGLSDDGQASAFLRNLGWSPTW